MCDITCVYVVAWPYHREAWMMPIREEALHDASINNQAPTER